MSAHPAYGDLLKTWRARRRRSQLDLALDAGISQKHLSFIETGRSAPSRDMVIRLSEVLDVPLRQRNRMLLSAGYAPLYLSRSLDDPSLAAARAAIEQLLTAHEPYPALAIDRGWNLITANRSLQQLLVVIGDSPLLQPPVNVLRLSLHPQGLAPFIANLPVWRAHVFHRLRHQIEATADGELETLLAELVALPGGEADVVASDTEVFVPLRLELPQGSLSLFSTTTVFGMPFDVTLSEIAIETFFPANEETRARLNVGT